MKVTTCVKESIETEIDELKANQAVLEESIEQGQVESKEIKKEVRELKNRAQAIEDSVYDLKAVNPNTVIEEDTRTPEELIAVIEEQGRLIAEALEKLKK